MYRYISWLAVGSAAVFLLVAQASYSPVTVAWLAFAITRRDACRLNWDRLRVSQAHCLTGDRARHRRRQRVDGCGEPGLLPSTAQNLAFAGALAIAGTGKRRPDGARTVARADRAIHRRPLQRVRAAPERCRVVQPATRDGGSASSARRRICLPSVAHPTKLSRSRGGLAIQVPRPTADRSSPPRRHSDPVPARGCSAASSTPRCSASSAGSDTVRLHLTN